MRRLTAATLLMVGGAVVAGPYHPQINLNAAVDRASPPSVALSGLWPDTCTPQLEEVAFNRGWVIHATAPRGESCRPETEHYSITVDLARFDDQPAAPIGVQSAPVRFFVRVGVDSVYRLLAFALAVWNQEPGAARPESGLWWPSSGEVDGGPGIGLTIEFQGDEAVIMVNSYAETGDPEWFVGSGTVDGRALAARLYRLSGGQTLFSDYIPPREAYDHGSVHLEFTGVADATAWFSRAVGSELESQLLLRPMRMERYRFGADNGARGLTGSWLLAIDGRSERLELIANAGSLRDEEHSIELFCSAGPGRERPTSCELRRAGVQLAVITDFGVNTMSGRTLGGTAVRLNRLR